MEAYPRIIRLKETQSTNQYIREYIIKERLPEGSVVTAEYQTAGRGQAGTHWESAPGANLMFSLVIYPHWIPVNRQFILSRMAALAAKDTLNAYTDGVSVKWPNDIYRRHKKIGGILIENHIAGQQIQSSIIGMGLNLNQNRFTGDAPNPVSLRQITGKEYDREEVLDRFLRIWGNYYLLLLQEKEEDICTAYMEALYRREGFFTYRDAGGLFEARIHSVEPAGCLLLQLRNGEIRRYAFKEVSYICDSLHS
ncbi:MAG: biotin--[acetyl-CoA-carboxylase] ligase [Tannerellaceae bacterium]|jgi:BirA family biotin operon repressor/biotin-[acetyl-CoA-carboxylase] ligase|nr:biotin--[acetyl-CoA-carboxylase] ligase [Tannerellaceae bacterium]